MTVVLEEKVRHVRTPAGMRRYKLPMNSPIVAQGKIPSSFQRLDLSGKHRLESMGKRSTGVQVGDHMVRGRKTPVLARDVHQKPSLARRLDTEAASRMTEFARGEGLTANLVVFPAPDGSGSQHSATVIDYEGEQFVLDHTFSQFGREGMVFEPVDRYMKRYPPGTPTPLQRSQPSAAQPGPPTPGTIYGHPRDKAETPPSNPDRRDFEAQATAMDFDEGVYMRDWSWGDEDVEAAELKYNRGIRGSMAYKESEDLGVLVSGDPDVDSHEQFNRALRAMATMYPGFERNLHVFGHNGSVDPENAMSTDPDLPMDYIPHQGVIVSQGQTFWRNKQDLYAHMVNDSDNRLSAIDVRTFREGHKMPAVEAANLAAAYRALSFLAARIAMGEEGGGRKQPDTDDLVAALRQHGLVRGDGPLHALTPDPTNAGNLISGQATMSLEDLLAEAFGAYIVNQNMTEAQGDIGYEVERLLQRAVKKQNSRVRKGVAKALLDCALDIEPDWEPPVQTKELTAQIVYAYPRGIETKDMPATVSPDPRAARLRRYWTRGEGALKIRWGMPGDWRRCIRQLDKYMPGRAEGYCANLHKLALGVWPGREGGRGHGRKALAVLESGTSVARTPTLHALAVRALGIAYGEVVPVAADGSGVVPALEVGGTGHGFEMVGPDTQTNPAQVVEVQVVGDGADEPQVDGAMGEGGVQTRAANPAVPVGVALTGPEPTGGSPVDEVKEVGRWFRSIGGSAAHEAAVVAFAQATSESAGATVVVVDGASHDNYPTMPHNQDLQQVRALHGHTDDSDAEGDNRA